MQCFVEIRVVWKQISFPPQDTFDIRILMAKSVKYTVNFLEAKEEDLYRCVSSLMCVCDYFRNVY